MFNMLASIDAGVFSARKGEEKEEENTNEGQFFWFALVEEEVWWRQLERNWAKVSRQTHQHSTAQQRIIKCKREKESRARCQDTSQPYDW